MYWSKYQRHREDWLQRWRDWSVHLISITFNKLITVKQLCNKVKLEKFFVFFFPPLLQFKWFQIEVLQAMEKNVKLDQEYIDVRLTRFLLKKKKNLTIHEVTVSKEKVYMTFLVRFWSINVFKSFWSFFLNLCQGLSFILTPFSLSCFICLTPDFLFFF